MSSFIAANSTYNIQSEKEISDALSQFSPEFIMDTIKYRFEDRINTVQLQNPNIPSAWEQYFKQLLNNYPMDKHEIEVVRDNTYLEIMRIICRETGMQFNENINSDLYSCAFYLYDFLIANFNNHMISFFANFIIREKNGIYDVLNLAGFKRNKDSTTIYNKRLDKNVKIAIINSNLEYVIDSMFNFDISFHNILETIYGGSSVVQLIESICLPIDDFYRTNYLPLLMSNMKPIIITNIRMAIQQQSMNQSVEINIVKEEQ